MNNIIEMEVAIKQKSNQLEFPVADLISQRKSVRAFANTPIEQSKINSLFEATRWAPSSTNEQPWMYLYATPQQPDLWEKMFDCLNEGNKIWAKHASLLVLSLARKNFSRADVPNAYALYDLGGANALLSVQAVAMGLQVRQMAGFNHAKAREVLNIPDAYETGVFMAIGYPGNPEMLPEQLKQREMAPRERYLQQEFVRNEIF